MPTGGAVRQAVLDHHADGDGDDPMGVMAVGQRQVRHVSIEVSVATRAAVLGVGDVQFPRPSAEAVSQIMQFAGDGSQAIGAVLALRTLSSGIVPRALNDAGSGQVFDTPDAFGGVGQVTSRTGHGQPPCLSHNPHRQKTIKTMNYSVTVL